MKTDLWTSLPISCLASLLCFTEAASASTWQEAEYTSSMSKLMESASLAPAFHESFTNASYFHNLAELTNSAFMAERAEDFSHYYKLAYDATAEFADPEQRVAALELGDDLVWGLASELMEPLGEEKTEAAESSAGGEAPAETGPGDLSYTVQQLFSLLNSQAGIDQSHYDDQAVLDSEALDHLTALKNRLVVSIRKQSPGGSGQESYANLGTGFFYGEYIVTCAHLFTKHCTKASGGELQIDLSPVRVFLANGEGKYEIDQSHGIRVQPSGQGTHFFFEWDCVFLKPVMPSEAALQAAVKARVQQFTPSPTNPVRFDDGSAPMHAGRVHGFAVTDAGAQPSVGWITPGPILFPPRAGRPNKAGHFADGAFQRAFRHHFSGIFSQPGNLISPGESGEDPASLFGILLKRALEHLLEPNPSYPGYGMCNDTSKLSCTLTYPITGDSKIGLFAKDPAFLSNPRIECVGADLYTEPFNSGAPILRLEEEVVVVGLLTGNYPTSPTTMVPPSLHHMARFIPMHRLLKECYAKIQD